MAFNTYKTLGDVLKNYRIRYEQAELAVLPDIKAPELLQEEIKFTLREIPFDVSEAAICENLIYPILRAVWKKYSAIFSIWSHQSIQNDDFNGIPDYLIAKRSELGKIILEAPFIAVVEAKKDDFTGGWAQCCLEMLALQKMNDNPDFPIYGIVSNGENWEIAQLQQSIFTHYTESSFVIQKLDYLCAALTTILENAKGMM